MKKEKKCCDRLVNKDFELVGLEIRLEKHVLDWAFDGYVVDVVLAHFVLLESVLKAAFLLGRHAVDD